MINIKDRPYITEALLGIMILVYLVMSVTGGTNNPYNLIRFGAKVNPLIIQGQYWRFVTPIFIHLNFTHILFNGITFYYLGVQIERLFGHLRFLIIFMISGIAGNMFSFAFNTSISVGASGAIFGLLGAFMMIGEIAWRNPAIRQMTKLFVIFILLNLVSDFLTVGIDISGHIGGLIAGFLCAYIVGLPHRLDHNSIKGAVAAVTLIIVLGIILYRGFNA
ncbi:rhomboid family intramembrane serine protease [Acetilactobacillus jinshanensis]|nr:rhomboid family intramembrane serine protease [Acetilactobacillus jinshanensis]